MRTDTTSKEFFEHKYRLQKDPWDFSASPYERARYDAIIQSLAHRRYDRAFEPGCSIGVLTARLASLCGYVHALDISPTAVQQARKRCAQLPNVVIACGAFRASLPSGEFDLIVLSEIGYYLEQDELLTVATTLSERLRRGGCLLAAHWLGESGDHLLSGDRVHEILSKVPLLLLEHSERHSGFRLDRWVRV
jgi:protein-L-isoaspartate O-methyltransferase